MYTLPSSTSYSQQRITDSSMESSITHEKALVLQSLTQGPGMLPNPSTPYIHRDLRNIDNTHMSLPELCEKISRIAALRELRIIASECYVSHTIVRHRYLILELHFRNSTVWMRGPANDTVALSLEKTKLIDQDSTQENRQECHTEHPLTLGEMMHFFGLLVKELTHYRLFDANCWLFTGAIQHYLLRQAHAKIVSGRFVKSNWASQTRDRVMTALHQLYNVSSTPVLLTDLHERLAACENHPLFTDNYYKDSMIPQFRACIAALEDERNTQQQYSAHAPNHNLSLMLHHAVVTASYDLPLSVEGCLVEVAIFLAKSCRSVSLALPMALNIKTHYLRQARVSEEDCLALCRQSLAIVTEWRQQPQFVQQHRSFCWIGGGFLSDPSNAGELFDDIVSAHLVGVETEARLLNKNPTKCVIHLVHWLCQLASYLCACKKVKEGCDIWARAIQAVQTCRCKLQCDLTTKSAYDTGGLACLRWYYGQSLQHISRTDESLEQYKAAIDTVDCASPYRNPILTSLWLPVYSRALLAAGRIEESYDALYECMENHISRAFIRKLWDPIPFFYYGPVYVVKGLLVHPLFKDDYHHHLRIILKLLSWLQIEYAHDWLTSLERELLWDYANALAALGRFEACEEALDNLVWRWQLVYAAEWADPGRPVLIDQWYFATLEMYVKILDIRGKTSQSRLLREKADTLLLQNTFSAPVCASELDRPMWKVHYDRDDPVYPPLLIYKGGGPTSTSLVVSLPLE